MKYLFVHEDGNITQQDTTPTDDDYRSVDAAILDIIRFENGRFEAARVDITSEESEEEEDEVEIEPEEEITVEWEKV